MMMMPPGRIGKCNVRLADHNTHISLLFHQFTLCIWFSLFREAKFLSILLFAQVVEFVNSCGSHVWNIIASLDSQRVN